MTGWILDTNVLSELRRPKPDRNVVAFVAAQPLGALHVSVVTLAEIRYGIAVVADAGRRAALQLWLDATVRPLFASRVMPISEDVMLRWRMPVEEGRRIRHTFSQPDLIIAATAIEHGMTVATRDTGGFDRTGAAVFDPWASP